jgi:hypothetical protein
MNLVASWIQWLAAGTLDGNWEFTGNVQIDGAITFGGLLTAAQINATSYYGAAGGIASFPAGLTSAGPIKCTSPVTRHLAPIDSCDSFGASPVATHSRGPAQWILAASTNPIYYRIPLQDAEQITGYSVGIQKNDTNNPVSVEIVSFNGSTGAEVTQSPGNSSPTTVGTWAVAESGLTLAGGPVYYVKVTPGGSITPAADRIVNCSVTFTRP